MKQMVATEQIEDIRSDEEVKEIINEQIFKTDYDHISFHFIQNDTHYSIYYTYPLNIIQQLLKQTNIYLIGQGLITQPFKNLNSLIVFFANIPLENRRVLSVQSTYLFALPLITGCIGNVRVVVSDAETENTIEGGFMIYYNDMDSAITFGGFSNLSNRSLCLNTDTTDIRIGASTNVYNLDISI